MSDVSPAKAARGDALSRLVRDNETGPCLVTLAAFSYEFSVYGVGTDVISQQAADFD